MIAYKLMRRRKNGTYGPLFIHRRKSINIGETHEAEDHPTKGFKHRPGWHCTKEPNAPHLKQTEDRVWVEVAITDYSTEQRPASQGGVWYLANRITFIKEI